MLMTEDMSNVRLLLQLVAYIMINLKPKGEISIEIRNEGIMIKNRKEYI